MISGTMSVPSGIGKGKYILERHGKDQKVRETVEVIASELAKIFRRLAVHRSDLKRETITTEATFSSDSNIVREVIHEMQFYKIRAISHFGTSRTSEIKICSINLF